MARSGRYRRADFYRTAIDVLDAAGPDALTIATVCDRLGVTKGSFYHQFGNLSGFVDGLTSYWRQEHTDRLIEASAAEPDPLRRVGVLTGIAVDLPHGAEAAFRAWSRDNPVVAAALREIDDAREAHIAASLTLLGMTEPKARRAARMSMAILVGSQQLQHPVDRTELRAMYEEFDRRILGIDGVGRTPAEPVQRAR